MRAAFANYLIGKNSSKHLFNEGRSVGVFHLILEPVKENIGKLVDIHLLCEIGGIALVVLEGMTKLFGVVKLFVTGPQIQEHFLYLIE